MAESPVKAAMRQAMNSKRPPGLEVTEDSHRNCLTCRYFNGAGLCKLYNYKVSPNEVCESWTPQPQ